ncbi:hypothetical protein [Sphingobacterium prati]|uniref:hypothetical protein n=1 Tax=Sphingobacterium prati TaxID=2737006 RepID=UPI0015577BE8|nr:hypothetical protein [Sphingobacterium prati]NPE47591.1 hypothetical protein [Sphingobacterium prati]
MNTMIRHSLVFLVFLLSVLLLKGMPISEQLKIHNSSGTYLGLSSTHKQIDKSADQPERENVVAAVHDHDLYDISEQVDLKDEWSKLLGLTVLYICLFIFCYPVCLNMRNNRTPYMDRLVLPPKYILFQSLKIPFQG